MLDRLLAKLPVLQHTGYFVVFIAALLEAIPAVGLVVPGQTILVIAGFVASTDVLRWWLIALIAMAGAIIGDTIGFYLGRRYGLSFLGKHKALLSDVIELLRAHPLKTLILGRFNSLTRSFAPFAAGASGVSTRRFMVANIVGGVIWALCWTGIGLLVGAGYGYASRTLETTALIALLIAAALFFLFRFLRRKYGLGYVAFGLASISALSILGFAFLVSNLGSGYVGLIDDVGRVLSLHSSETVSIALSLVFTAVIHPITLAFISVTFTSGLLLARKPRAAALFLLAIFGAVTIALMVKGIVTRPRPDSALLWSVTIGSAGFDSWSFPSGHSLLATAVFGSIALTLRRLTIHKRLIASMCTVMVIGISASRVSLGVHWASDVLAGVILGLFWISVLYLLDEAARARGAAVRFAKRQKPRDTLAKKESSSA